MKLKVCGMREMDNIRELAKLRPDYMGFIFYPASKRFVGEDFILPELPGILKTGVFVNQEKDVIEHAVHKYGLDLVQLHGDESVEFCEAVSRSVKVMKAFGVDEAFDFSLTAAYEAACAFFLFDSVSEQRGGSGKRFDHALLAEYHGKRPFFLSGGVGPADMVVKPDHKMFYGWDVNSKFEISAGLKDVDGIKRSFAAVRMIN